MYLQCTTQQALTCMYSCETITAITIISVSITAQNFLVPFCNPYLLPLPTPPTGQPVSVPIDEFALPRILDKWTPTAYPHVWSGFFHSTEQF